MNEHVWLGGTDREEEGVWRWATTGEVLSYTSWSGDEPNNELGGEHCMSQGPNPDGWNDVRCNVEKRALCEF